MIKLLGVDAGNFETKVCCGNKVEKWSSALGEYRTLKLENQLGAYDWAWEYEGEKGFAGNLAKRESEYLRSKLGDTKAHHDAYIRVLLACHKYGTDFNLVVGQPISQHSKGEKSKIKDALVGEHSLTVNGVNKIIKIHEMEVCPETASAIFCEPTKETVQIVDVGAGTIGIALIENMQYIDKKSQSIDKGANSVKNLDIKALSEYIATLTNVELRTILVGGLATTIEEEMKKLYRNVEVMKPLGASPTYANCVGFYKLGEKRWQATTK